MVNALRLLVIPPTDTKEGEFYIVGGFSMGEKHYDAKPCKLQELVGHDWVDVPWEIVKAKEEGK